MSTARTAIPRLRVSTTSSSSSRRNWSQLFTSAAPWPWLFVVLTAVLVFLPGQGILATAQFSPVANSAATITSSRWLQGFSSPAENNSTLLEGDQGSTASNNVMTDDNLTEAVRIWCDNPTLAVQYFGPMEAWNTSLVTNFRGLFRKQTKFNDDISQWDTSSVTSMAAMYVQTCVVLKDAHGLWKFCGLRIAMRLMRNADKFAPLFLLPDV